MFEDLFASGGLSMERLHALILLSDAGSLIGAAKGDSGLQSRLSHRLRELSAFIGTELTMRAGKTVKLTAAGESLAQMARQHFHAIRAFRAQVTGTALSYCVAAGDSLMQWLLVPAIGAMRRGSSPIRLTLCNLRTKNIVDELKDHRVEFGVLRADALEPPLKQVRICRQTYAVFVPRRLVPSRGLLSLPEALLRCPHAAIAGDGQLMERLRGLARSVGGAFTPELTCDSLGQCVAAVRTGAFAAVLPVQAWRGATEQDYVVVEHESLEALTREIVLAWHPRLIDIFGAPAVKMQRALADALKRVGGSAVEM